MGIDPMSRLEKIATELNAESDSFRLKIEAIEQALEKMHIGIEVEVQGWGYGKVAQHKWKFFKVGVGERIPVLELRRQDRLELARVIESLLDQLSEKGGAEKYRVEQANIVLDQQLKRLSHEPKV